MIKVLKRHVCLCALTTSVFFGVSNIGTYAQDSKLPCNSRLKSYLCDAFEKFGSSRINNIDFFDVTNVKKFDREIIKVGEKGSLGLDGAFELKNTGIITLEVLVPEKTKVVLEKIFVDGIKGKNVSSYRNPVQKPVFFKVVDAMVFLGNVPVYGDASNRAVFGIKQGGYLHVKDSNVNVTDAYGLLMESSEYTVNPFFVAQPLGHFILGPTDFCYSTVIFENSNITVNGSETRGFYLNGELSEDEYIKGETLAAYGKIQLKKTDFYVPNGTAIYIDNAKRIPYITASEGSYILADRLLHVKNNSNVAVEADASFFVGGAHVEKGSYAEVELSNNSKWTVTRGENNNQKSVQSTDSSVSFMRIIDSSIVFQKPKDAHYQTLHIGSVEDNRNNYAYISGGDARLYVNAHIATNGESKEIKADKLVIYGDVYGKTKVHVVDVSANSRKIKSHSQGKQKRSRSISIVQVYGNAAEDSFKLATNYVALRGAPYRYSLRAYGPNSSLGKAKDRKKLAQQKSGNSNGDFWDFRLEAAYVKKLSRQRRTQLTKDVSRRRTLRSIGSSVGHNHIVADSEASIFYPEMEIQAVVPQVPTYLLLPNALFHAGLMDISNQNKQLAILRASSEDLLDSGKKPAFFVRSYGGNHHYASDLSDLEYGYGGDLDYSAVEAGILLKAVESARHTLSFGVMGTYGKLSLQPQDVDQSQKSSFDKWIATAYG
ncbi:autotransporter outer membrane beta-barrel domain-containing protein, partial [Bartonella heixiaziensis]|uniref:autotransporter outer membrane beta-barrel domain-containing protein n=1 Tax=Bartonella heixiaziensis TaxID=1461000 RepID=UPI003D1F6B9E